MFFLSFIEGLQNCSRFQWATSMALNKGADKLIFWYIKQYFLSTFSILWFFAFLRVLLSVLWPPQRQTFSNKSLEFWVAFPKEKKFEEFNYSPFFWPHSSQKFFEVFSGSREWLLANPGLDPGTLRMQAHALCSCTIVYRIPFSNLI